VHEINEPPGQDPPADADAEDECLRESAVRHVGRALRNFRPTIGGRGEREMRERASAPVPALGLGTPWESWVCWAGRVAWSASAVRHEWPLNVRATETGLRGRGWRAPLRKNSSQLAGGRRSRTCDGNASGTLGNNSRMNTACQCRPGRRRGHTAEQVPCLTVSDRR
jgi:hypothetical protein